MDVAQKPTKIYNYIKKHLLTNQTREFYMRKWKRIKSQIQ